jgi:hypothetical protein
VFVRGKSSWFFEWLALMDPDGMSTIVDVEH